MSSVWKSAAVLVTALSLTVAQVPALAQAAAKTAEKQAYEPHVGQPGKDVVWVPTPEALVERMLEMARVTSKDYVVDLGSGDGRTVIMAAQKYGVNALGIEYNPDMVALSVKAAAKAGVSDKAKFIQADIFETDFSKATVLTMYLLPALNVKLRPRILDMRPGTRVVSHAFNMEDWAPDQTATVEGRNAYLWIVPAKVQGSWAVSVPAGNGDHKWRIALAQTFQKISGTATREGKSYPLIETRLRGAEIAFAFVDGSGVKRRFSGRVAGASMEGTTTTQGGAKARWVATPAATPAKAS
ncbi:MAG: methyltransferase domain-containing protein [Burkholderiales bacterium]|nr:methyltransferase domain-containing protein [Burkholderiales bacterium]